MHWDVIIPMLRRKFQNQLEAEFMYEDWLHSFYRKSFKTRFEICKDEDGNQATFVRSEDIQLRHLFHQD